MKLIKIAFFEIILSTILAISFPSHFAFACGPGADPYDDYEPVTISRSLMPMGEIRAGARLELKLCMTAFETIDDAAITVHIPKEIDVLGRLDISPTADKEWYKRKASPSSDRDISWKGVIETPKKPFFYPYFGKRPEKEQCVVLQLVSKTDSKRWSFPIKGRAAFFYYNNGEYYSWNTGYYFSNMEWSHSGHPSWETMWVGKKDFSYDKNKQVDIGKKNASAKDISVLRIADLPYFRRAYIETPDGEIHSIIEGDFIGKRAKVTRITPTSVVLTETTKNGNFVIMFLLKGNSQTMAIRKLESREAIKEGNVQSGEGR